MALSHSFSQENLISMPREVDLILQLELSLGYTSVADETTTHPKRCLGDVQCTPNKKRRLAKKTVRFGGDDKNTVVYRHLSDEDLDRAWIHRDGYQAIRQENRNTISALMKVYGSFRELDDTQYCIRGLETAISVLIFRTDREKNLKIVRGILREQNIQRASGLFDPTTLTAVSMIMTRDSRIKALRRASSDASP
jgi:hypothetical protein